MRESYRIWSSIRLVQYWLEDTWTTFWVASLARVPSRPLGTISLRITGICASRQSAHWCAICSTSIYACRQKGACAGSKEKLFPKPLLPAQSAHPRFIKNGLVKSVLLSVQIRSWEYELGRAIKSVLKRLKTATYSSSFMFSALLTSMTRKAGKKKTLDGPRSVIIR